MRSRNGGISNICWFFDPKVQFKLLWNISDCFSLQIGFCHDSTIFLMWYLKSPTATTRKVLFCYKLSKVNSEFSEFLNTSCDWLKPALHHSFNWNQLVVQHNQLKHVTWKKNIDKLFDWFSDNFLRADPDKCHLLIVTDKKCYIKN